MKIISALLGGVLFGVGLAASGMTNTAKVIGFLAIFGNWDSDLLFVMGAAVITTFVGYKLVFKRQTPLFADNFSLPASTVIDRQLITGAVLFGIGWGLYGYCPGPAIAALAYLSPITASFVICMLIGMGISNWLIKNAAK